MWCVVFSFFFSPTFSSLPLSLLSDTAVAQEREVEGDLFLWDMGEGLGFRPGSFDGAISISALQWLCNADRRDHHPPKRLYQFFSSLYACLVSGT
jgi:18S rRNA (guanine1575-N7)-methyltransferase